MHLLLRIAIALVLVVNLAGCSTLVGKVSTMPTVRNPFPQLQRVAVAPFANLSDEPTVDGRKFALAYFAELQATPGFEVVPLGVVEEAIIANSIDMTGPSGPAEARRLAKILGVDAVVVGAVTDYDIFYPPRCGMRVDWYAANPGFHKIPSGYGLPWGTPEEEYIPPDVIYAAELELATEQMKTQSPDCDGASPAPLPSMNARPMPSGPPPAVPQPPTTNSSTQQNTSGWRSRPSQPQSRAGQQAPSVPTDDSTGELSSPEHGEAQPAPTEDGNDNVVRQPGTMRASYKVATAGSTQAPLKGGTIATTEKNISTTSPAMLPADWPDPRGFTPPGPSPVRPPCIPNDGPVMTHTRIFHGHDPEFTSALAAYVDFRDDARFGTWRAYLSRSEDFIRFCCHLHIVEMLSARGGAAETRVLEHPPDCR